MPPTLRRRRAPLISAEEAAGVVGISYLFDTMHCSFTVSDITTPSLLDTNVPL